MFTWDPKWYFVSPWKKVLFTLLFIASEMKYHCVKSVQIRSFSGPYFLYSVRIQRNTDQKKLRIWTLFMQIIISFQGSSDWIGPLQNVNKPGQDIETNMLEATIQTFIKEVVRWTNTVADKNSKFLIIWQMDLTTNAADFKLLPK